MLVFISHSESDKETAEEIGIFLVAENIGVWFDQWEIVPGDSIPGRINEGLSNCTHLLVLWSKNSAGSKWVQRELNSTVARAIAGGSPTVIVVRLDDAPVLPLLADIQYIRYRCGSEEDRRNLVFAVAGRSPSGSLIRSIVKKYHEVIRSAEREDSFGLIACPQCGSDRIEPWTDCIVDVDHHGVMSGTEIPAVRCLECNWQAEAGAIHRDPSDILTTREV
jgi:hypothetical protein